MKNSTEVLDMKNSTEVLVEVQSLKDIKTLLEMDGPLEDSEIDAVLIHLMSQNFEVFDQRLESLGLWTSSEYKMIIIAELNELYAE